MSSVRSADPSHVADVETPSGGDLAALESRLAHTFQNPELLQRALTHRSYANEHGDRPADNEVLEFLGDAALGLVVSDILCTEHAHLNEGEMSKLKSYLVSAETLGRLANELGLGSFVLLGRGEEKTLGREKQSILANSFEALIAALYLDGGLDAARAFLVPRMNGLLVDAADETAPVHDYKSALQEAVQALGLRLPLYGVVDEEGPDHDKIFHVRVDAGTWNASGRGRTKKSAEQIAARVMLDRIGSDSD